MLQPAGALALDEEEGAKERALAFLQLSTQPEARLRASPALLNGISATREGFHSSIGAQERREKLAEGIVVLRASNPGRSLARQK